jgi:hypothetical protein
LVAAPAEEEADEEDVAPVDEDADAGGGTGRIVWRSRWRIMDLMMISNKNLRGGKIICG